MKTIISAVSYDSKTGNLGIGLNNNLPWHIPDDLKFFKNITLNSVVVMGRKTFDSLNCVPLINRVNVVLTSDKEIKKINYPNLIFANSIKNLDEIISILEENYKTIYIIGGQSVYTHYIDQCQEIILTHVHKKYECDTFLPKIPCEFKITSYTKQKEYTRIIYQKQKYYMEILSKNPDNIYNNLVSEILMKGEKRKDRTNIGTTSMFGKQLKFNISENCPLLSSKRVAWKTCIKELLWFLRGETDANILKNQGVHIWDKNSSREFLDSRLLYNFPEGELGKVYGWQIRHSGGDFEEKTGGVDQLAYIENLLKNDPFSRRILWNLWIPSDLNSTALNPCHYSFQLYVSFQDNKKILSGLVILRSNDLFLGNPFNVFSYYVLIRLLCLKHDMEPGELILSIGDAHIYNNHIDQIAEQLSRQLLAAPVLNINNNVKTKDWEKISIEDFDVVGYFPYPSIKAEMAV